MERKYHLSIMNTCQHWALKIIFQTPPDHHFYTMKGFHISALELQLLCRVSTCIKISGNPFIASFNLYMWICIWTFCKKIVPPKIFTRTVIHLDTAVSFLQFSCFLHHLTPGLLLCVSPFSLNFFSSFFSINPC